MTKPWDDEDTEQLHVLHKQTAFLCGVDNGTVALCMRSVDALRGQASRIRELEARVMELTKRVAAADAEYTSHERSLECQCWQCMTYQIQQLDVDVALRDTAIETGNKTEADLRAQLAASIPREKLADALGARHDALWAAEDAATQDVIPDLLSRAAECLRLRDEVRNGTFPPMDETTKGVAGE